MSGHDIARKYSQKVVSGWLGKDRPEFVREQFEIVKERTGGLVTDQFNIVGAKPYRSGSGKKVFLHKFARALLGSDPPDFPQATGDCTSFGQKHVTNDLQAVQIVMNSERQKWRPVFPPFFYGASRVYIGRGRLGNEDGSLGSWIAEAALKYGVLWADEPGVPEYSGAVAKAWGDPNPANDLDKFKDIAKNYLFGKAVLVTSWDQLVEAISNGYPVNTCSNIGYDMLPSSDGFHRQTDNWGHSMEVYGVDDNSKDPYALIKNSWGDCHGHLKDFESDEDLPLGTLRVRRADMEKHLWGQDTYAYSHLNGFPAQDIEKALFLLISAA